MRGKPNKPDIVELARLIVHKNLEVNGLSPFYEQIVDGYTEEKVELWFNIKNNQGVQGRVLYDRFCEDDKTLRSPANLPNLEQECNLEKRNFFSTVRSLLEPLSKLEEGFISVTSRLQYCT